jgi:hypothetical protein
VVAVAVGVAVGVTVDGDDDGGRERLLRYCARAAADVAATRECPRDPPATRAGEGPRCARGGVFAPKLRLTSPNGGISRTCGGGRGGFGSGGRLLGLSATIGASAGARVSRIDATERIRPQSREQHTPRGTPNTTRGQIGLARQRFGAALVTASDSCVVSCHFPHFPLCPRSGLRQPRRARGQSLVQSTLHPSSSIRTWRRSRRSPCRRSIHTCRSACIRAVGKRECASSRSKKSLGPGNPPRSCMTRQVRSRRRHQASLGRKARTPRLLRRPSRPRRRLPPRRSFHRSGRSHRPRRLRTSLVSPFRRTPRRTDRPRRHCTCRRRTPGCSSTTGTALATCRLR